MSSVSHAIVSLLQQQSATFDSHAGLAHNPTTRFPSLIPISEAAECARQIVEGVRREQEEVYIPAVLNMSFKVGRCFPRRVQLALNDFLQCGVGYRGMKMKKKNE